MLARVSGRKEAKLSTNLDVADQLAGVATHLSDLVKDPAAGDESVGGGGRGGDGGGGEGQENGEGGGGLHGD